LILLVGIWATSEDKEEEEKEVVAHCFFLGR